MLVKGQNLNMPIFYWILLIPIFFITSYKSLFFDWHIQLYYFNELEDFGRYVFVLGISFVEAFIYVSIIRSIVFLVQKMFKNKSTLS
ncbi:hypothetical protein [Rummeliibacillus pycnus]|uniref:hypothetical protein n=1 Tax=Rummeliibacillus pycnus TaxID=101070 RepID=UPI003D2E325D